MPSFLGIAPVPSLRHDSCCPEPAHRPVPSDRDPRHAMRLPGPLPALPPDRVLRPHLAGPRRLRPADRWPLGPSGEGRGPVFSVSTELPAVSPEQAAVGPG